MVISNMTNTEKRQTFSNELNLIHDPYILDFTIKSIQILPDYFFEIPASSSGKYHPDYALGKGGLVLHTKAAVAIAHSMFKNIVICDGITEDDKDLIISALILHDGLKSGMFNSKHTEVTHPILITSYLNINLQLLYGQVYNDAMNEIFPLINSHMGPWNTDRNGLEFAPVPSSAAEKFVHLCDYLASRNFIEINFNKCTV